MFLGFYQRLKIAGLMKLEDTSNTTLAALVTRLFLFLCLSLVFTLVYKIKKLIIYLMFSFCSFWFWGKVICIEKKTNVSCALSMNGMLSCSWM